MLIALLLAAATPSPEALALGRQVAEGGTLGSLLPLMQEKEADDLIAKHPELIAAEKDALKRTAKLVFDAAYGRIMDAEGRAIAERLSIEDLRALSAFNRSDAAKRWKAALPQVIMATMGAMQGLDYKKDVAAAYCKESGKLCAEAK